MDVSNSMRRAFYVLALAGEIIFLYYGFSFLLLGYMPLKHRLIGSAVFFPLAALASWWSGSLSMPQVAIPGPEIARPPAHLRFAELLAR
jgi:hypothetical protein